LKGGGKVSTATATATIPADTASLGSPPHDAQDAHLESLFMRYYRYGDPAARDALAERFLPLARKLARRYARSSEPYEDLVQVASFGLIKAIDRFDPTRGRRFEAFAVPTILGELRRYFRDCTWAVHVSRSGQERASAIESATTILTEEHGHSPTLGQLGQYLEISREEVLDGLQASLAYTASSLDAPCGSGEEEDTCTIRDAIGAVDDRYELVEAGIVVRDALRSLSERERLVLSLRFLSDMTQAEIAAEIGVSQMQVSRILRDTLARLREVADVPNS
jgi:RNA polymerase sigma-B factor